MAIEQLRTSGHQVCLPPGSRSDQRERIGRRRAAARRWWAALPPGLVFLVAVLSVSAARAQFGTPLEFLNQNREVDQERTQQWRAGIILEAATGPCVNIYGTFSVPVDWPEQDVKVVTEEISEMVRQTQYRDLEEGVRQMVFVAPRLEMGERLEVLITFEVTRRLKPPPSDTSVYRIPENPPRGIRKHLLNSPQIDCRHSKIRLLAKEITADKETAWEQAEAIYEWVKENITHTNDPLKGTLATLQDKKGGHEDLAGIFIALCRASKIPARIVWVPGYCYAEFCLQKVGEQDTEGEEDMALEEWFPCEFKEKTQFAKLSQPYLILQKGENVRVPEVKARKRFVPEFVKVKSGNPVVTTVRDRK